MATATRIYKRSTPIPHQTGSVGLYANTAGTPQYNPDGTARNLAPIVVVVPTVAASVDNNVFIAPFACKLVRAQGVQSVVGGASAACDIKKCTGTTAPASGTTMLASAFDGTSTINTVVDKSLSATAANLTLAAGDRVAADFSGTLTGWVGAVTLTFVQV